MDDQLDLEYERVLGEGSYGKVFLVRQQDGQQFAVKEIDLSKCDEDGRTQASHEASLLSRLKHENILTYIESVINDEALYIVTEYCGGGDLEDYLEIIRKSKLTVPEPMVSEWVLQIGGALKYLHDLRILHRDMKTKNIFLKEDLTVKLGDLGIAKVLDLNQSKANTFIGTPSYMSPELFTGKPYNHKTDIWGLGCCAYEMLTLKRAFEGKALWTLIREIRNGKELDLPDEYSLELRVLIEEMMSQDPNTRPSANDIVKHDYLSYHRGTAKEWVSHLPVPGIKEEKKKKVSANLSGSFDRMLQQKNKQEDLRLRSSIANICEKINTLRSSMAEEDMGTFVYHGDGENDGELEASNTILDSDTLKQFTQQLDTFVYKGDSDSDSDYYTEGSLGRKGGGDEQDSSRKLITQYSNSLEEMENDGEETVNNGGVESFHVETEGEDIQVKNVEDMFDADDKFLIQMNDKLEETLTSKYSKYNRIKDTLTLSQGKKFRRSHSESSPSAIKAQQIFDRTGKDSSKLKTGKHLSASFSGADTLHHADQTAQSTSLDPRLNKTFSSERQLKQNVGKMKTCDRLEQSFLSKSQSSKGLKPTKNAFSDDEVKPVGDLDVTGVMSHLKEKLTLYTEENSPLGQDNIEILDEQGSPNRKGKKKNPFIKKEAARKKSLDSDHEKINIPSTTDENVTLYTRAQAVAFNKEEGCITNMNGDQSELQKIQKLMNDGNSAELTNDHLLFVQRALANRIGVNSLKQVMDIMSMVQSEEEMKIHLANILGPASFEENKLFLLVLHRLEILNFAIQPTQ